jgi:putative DNA primase/helicase
VEWLHVSTCKDHVYAGIYASRYKQKLAYVPELGHWLEYTGKLWEEHPNDAPAKRAAIQVLAAQEASVSAERVQSLLAMAAVHPDLEVRLDRWDRGRHFFNTPAGTFDLRTFENRGHRAEDYVTRMSGVPPSEEPAARKWIDHLVWALGEDMIPYFCRLCGYWLTGETREQQFYMLSGSGGNGKSVVLDVLLRVMGSYARTAPAGLTNSKDGVPREDALARVRGCRFIRDSEPEPGFHLCESVLKQFTGDGQVSARELYQKSFEYEPVGKIAIASNFKLRVKGTDDGIWRRLRPIHFPNKVSEEDKNPNLMMEIFEDCGPAVLRWCLMGAKEYYRSGLQEPDRVRQLNAEYRQEMDVIGAFLSDQCVDGGEIRNDDLYRLYADWCNSSGENPWTQRALTIELKRRGYEQRRNDVFRFWNGLSRRAAE